MTGVAALPMTFRFERDPQEHADVMLAAGVRFMGGRRTITIPTFFCLVFAIAVAIYVAMAGYRDYVLVPHFGVPETLDTLDLLMIGIPPMIVYALSLGFYARRITRARLAGFRARLRPGLMVNAAISEDGLTSETSDLSLRLGWREVVAIADNNGRIDFEMESFVAYLPGRCFRDEQERQAVLAVARDFHAAALRAKP